MQNLAMMAVAALPAVSAARGGGGGEPAGSPDFGALLEAELRGGAAAEMTPEASRALPAAAGGDETAPAAEMAPQPDQGSTVALLVMPPEMAPLLPGAVARAGASFSASLVPAQGNAGLVMPRTAKADAQPAQHAVLTALQAGQGRVEAEPPAEFADDGKSLPPARAGQIAPQLDAPARLGLHPGEAPPPPAFNLLLSERPEPAAPARLGLHPGEAPPPSPLAFNPIFGEQFVATPASRTPKIDSAVGAPGWDEALGQKVVWLVSQQQQVAELHLNPPDLGPLEVVLTVSNDQASALFVSPHASVREAIESALPRLREMMAENGITLGNATVSDDSFQGQAGTEREHHSPQRRADTELLAPGVRSSVLVPARRTGLVDTFA